MQNETPILFSIITVCLNAGADLKETIASVLSQDFHGFELIVKDGGSQDGSIDSLPVDGRIRVIRQPDAGIFDAMNQGLSRSKGQFICFLNAGDFFWDSTVLSDVAKSISCNNETNFFYGDVYKAQGRAGFNFYPERLSRFFLFTNMICHQCWFVRRETYLAYGGFETEFPIGGDYRLLLKMIGRDKQKYKHVPRAIVCYQGSGRSADPVLQKQNEHWRAEIRSQLFSSTEYAAFSITWKIWSAVKKCTYDKIIWRAWRNIQHRRGKRFLKNIVADRKTG